MLLILSQLVSELFSSVFLLAHYSPSRVTVVRERHVSHSLDVHNPEHGEVVLDHVAALNANQHRGLAVAVRLPDVCKEHKSAAVGKNAAAKLTIFRPSHFKLLRVPPHDPVDNVHLLEPKLDRVSILGSAVGVGHKELENEKSCLATVDIYY
jgi:hypothetical protein